MTVYYFEGSPIAAPLTFESRRVVLGVETATLREHRRDTDAQRWELTFKVVTNDNENTVFDALLDTAVNARTMDMPQLRSVDAVYEDLSETSAFAISGSASVGQSSVTVVRTQPLPRGSFIQFTNHDKIYMVTSNHTTSGTSAVTFDPPLRAAVSSANSVRHPNCTTKPQFNYLRSLDVPGKMVFTDGVLADPGPITLVEDV